MAPPPPVIVRHESVTLPTYEPERPDRNPMFLDRRVYQGSSGRVYPLPFTDRIADRPVQRTWVAIIVENEFLLVMLLPELGGRIHRILDKTNGYDLVYHQPVIKPALVGLAGPWCSGGIEFNWPQHHRPSTFLPTDVAIEHAPDGSATVWMSEHDPLARMKGMHGVRLHPGRALVEVVARIHNRTADQQTFLWWANVATRVHEAYQSFFPPDVTHVADHAKRATGTFPHCSGRYYGVDYGSRRRDGVPPAERPRHYLPPHLRHEDDATAAEPPLPHYSPDDLSWYANIPVPTSYMAMGSREDFCGGYDFKARAGLVHVANHHLSPGKKQWTWGNHDFGYAWDRNLTDPDPVTGECAPYIELMAGVFTDNQPDFSFLQPGETRTWSQYWYPIREIGPAHHANLEAAVSLQLVRGRAQVGVSVTGVHRAAIVRLELRGRLCKQWTHDLSPAHPFLGETTVRLRSVADAFTLRVVTTEGRELIAYTPRKPPTGEPPPAATAPAPPSAIPSNDVLYLTGLHLEQYRHATRSPEPYWREALKRDPGDARCHLALGRWHLRRGELNPAENHLRASVARLTALNPNPADGEPYYQLGLCLRHHAMAAGAVSGRGHFDADKLTDAYDAFYKATWNHAWQSPAFHALAEIDALRGKWSAALDHLDRALAVNSLNFRARNLRTLVLRRLNRASEAEALLQETLALDPLDAWARHLAGQPLDGDRQVHLDVALDCARAGLFREALAVLADAEGESVSPAAAGSTPSARSLGTAPLVRYYLGWLSALVDDASGTAKHLAAARRAAPDYCFPARVEEIAILTFALARNPRDARATFYLGNLLYDRHRRTEAIACWERTVKHESANAVAWRNLGIGYFNALRQPARALRAYERARRAAPADARVLYERDQLGKRLGESPERRLKTLLRHPSLVAQRDDLSIEACALYNQTGAPEAAEALLAARKFQPWEGGEGQVLAQHVRTHLALGRRALDQNEPATAVTLFRAALAAPANLGEARHPLANASDIHYWIGCAHAAQGEQKLAQQAWSTAAANRGDFQEMSVRAFSELTYFSARALECLGRRAEARRLFRALLAHGRELARKPATIDYFATSLPAMLLFEDDLDARQKTTALLLQAQAHHGLGESNIARRLLRTVLRRDPNHPVAADLLASLNSARNHAVARRSSAG